MCSRCQLSFITITRNYISEHAGNRHLDLLSELLQRDKNHPSVVMWSVASHSATAHSRNIDSHLRRMMDFTREIDVQKRPVTYVTSSNDRIMVVEDPAVRLARVLVQNAPISCQTRIQGKISPFSNRALGKSVCMVPQKAFQIWFYKTSVLAFRETNNQFVQ